MSIQPTSSDTSFCLKSIFSKIEMAAPACFLNPFAWNIFFFSIFNPEVKINIDVQEVLFEETEEWILFCIYYIFFEMTDVERYQLTIF